MCAVDVNTSRLPERSPTALWPNRLIIIIIIIIIIDWLVIAPHTSSFFIPKLLQRPIRAFLLHKEFPIDNSLLNTANSQTHKQSDPICIAKHPFT
jgi:hypothetical protein